MRLRHWSWGLPVLVCACAGPSTTIPGVTSGEVAEEQRKQQLHLVQSYFAQSGRLNSVAHRVMVANRADCKEDVSARFGMQALSANDLPPRLKQPAIEALGFSQNALTVISVVEGGPAAKAGIVAGDELVALDDEPIPAENPSDWIGTYLKKSGERRIRIEVRRGGQSQVRTAQPVMSCSMPVFLATDEQVNAYTDGKRIVVNSGVLRVAQTDAELAVVFGHELAHITMGHVQKKQQNRVAGAVGGAVVDIGLAVLGVNTGGAFTRGLGNAGGLAFANEFEREADYVGMYYVARAGYDNAGTERFWRAMAQESPKQIFYAGLHPTSPERFLLIQKTNEEIADKKRRRSPLNPEPKAPAVAAAETAPPTN